MKLPIVACIFLFLSLAFIASGFSIAPVRPPYVVDTEFVFSSASPPIQSIAPKQQNIPPQLALRPRESHGKWGFVDDTGAFVIKPTYFAVQPFREGLALVETSKSSTPLGLESGEFRLAQITYIDRVGHEIRSPLSVRRAGSFSEGFAIVVPDSVGRLSGACAKGGYLNRRGGWGIEPQFDGLMDFSEGLAAVNLDGNCGVGGVWGYIDKDGRLAIPYKFLWAGQFHNGRACAGERRGEDEVIDLSGHVLPNEKCH